MEINPKISVIVPIYKVEGYIRRCLDSIKAQSFEDFEVVMINDGTPDASAEIAAEYTSDPRFRLYSQPNGGVGAARNKGVELARGEYVAFVDSDDGILPDHLENLYRAAAESGSDISCCGYRCYSEDWLHGRTCKIYKRSGVYFGESLYGVIIRDISLRRYIWGKLYKKSLFTDNGLYFPNRLFEDTYIIPLLFYYAGKIAVVKEKTYIYTRRKGSITGFGDRRCINDYIRANEEVEDFYLSAPEGEFYLKHMMYQRCKTASVTFCWAVIQAFKIRDAELFKTSLSGIGRYLTAPMQRSGYYLMRKKRKKVKV